MWACVTGLKYSVNLKRLFLNSNKIHDGGIIALARTRHFTPTI